MTVPTTLAPADSKWRAGLYTSRIYSRRILETPDGKTKVKSVPITLHYLVLERGESESISFFLNWANNQLTFTDSRDCTTGTAGSTGQWGTRPPSKSGKRRTLTSTAWKAEVLRLIGSEQADRVIRHLSRGKPSF